MILTVEAADIHIDNGDGYCASCDAITRLGGLYRNEGEPLCPICKRLIVCSIDRAIAKGWIKIDYTEDGDAD